MKPRARLGVRVQSAGIAAAAALVVLIPIGWALFSGSGQPVRQLALSGGGAWLASPNKGYVTLIDGPSEQVVATVLAPSGGNGVSVTQDGASAFVADNTTGTVTRVDGATYQALPPVQFGSAGSDLSVLPGGDSAYVIDATSREAIVIDAATLALSRRMSIAARPGPQQTLVDGSDRLWAVDADGTGLTWFDPTGNPGRAAADPSARLLNVGGRAVLVNLGETQPEISWLGADGSTQPWSCHLSSRTGDAVQLLGSSTSAAVYAAVSQSGTLVVADGQGGSCGGVVPVGAPGAVFGGLAQSSQFVFVPNQTTGATAVVDTTRAGVVATLPLADPGHHIQLLAKDGLVFYNDLDSEKAGVLRESADGSWIAGNALQKYNPDTGAPANPVGSQSSAGVASSELASSEQASTTQQSTSSEPPAPPSTSSSSSPTGTASTTVPPSPTTPRTSTSVRPTPASTSKPSPSTPSASLPPPPSPTQQTSDPTPVSTMAPPPPVVPAPVVADIVAAGDLSTGATASFSATVTNPAGAWNWTASSDTGTELATSTAEGSFSFPVPSSGLTSVTVALTVGSSAPLSKTFPVTVAPVATSVDTSGVRTHIWDNDTINPNVSVASAAGSGTPTGTVTLRIHNPADTPTDVDQPPVTLTAGGSAGWDAVLPGAAATVTLTYHYSGDLTHQASSAIVTVSVTTEALLQDSGCRHGDPALGESFADAYLYALVTPDSGGSNLSVSIGGAGFHGGAMTYRRPGPMATESELDFRVDPSDWATTKDYDVTMTEISTGITGVTSTTLSNDIAHGDCLL